MGIPGHLWVMLGEWQIIALSDFCRWVCDLHSEVQPDSEREPGLDPDFLEKDQQPPCSKEILIVHLPLHVVINIFSTGLLPRKVLSINLASSTALLRNVSHTLSHVIQRIQIPFFFLRPFAFLVALWTLWYCNRFKNSKTQRWWHFSSICTGQLKTKEFYSPCLEWSHVLSLYIQEGRTDKTDA